MDTRFEIEVRNPRGVIEPSPVYAPAKRIDDLAGKTVGLYSNGKDGMVNFYQVFSEVLKDTYPTAKTLFISGDYLINDRDAEEWGSKIDTFVYGVGD